MKYKIQKETPVITKKEPLNENHEPTLPTTPNDTIYPINTDSPRLIDQKFSQIISQIRDHYLFPKELRDFLNQQKVTIELTKDNDLPGKLALMVNTPTIEKDPPRILINSLYFIDELNQMDGKPGNGGDTIDAMTLLLLPYIVQEATELQLDHDLKEFIENRVHIKISSTPDFAERELIGLAAHETALKGIYSIKDRSISRLLENLTSSPYYGRMNRLLLEQESVLPNASLFRAYNTIYTQEKSVFNNWKEDLATTNQLLDILKDGLPSETGVDLAIKLIKERISFLQKEPQIQETTQEFYLKELIKRGLRSKQ
jgi:hypothetical protein